MEALFCTIPNMPPPSFVDSARRHVPRRTAEGQAELNTRRRPLTRRQRTVLILVDGQRNLEQVLALAMQAGAGGAAFGELVAMGLIVAPGVGGVEVIVELGTTHVGTTSLVQCYRVREASSGDVWCEAEALLVGWDGEKRTKAAWSSAFRAALARGT